MVSFNGKQRFLGEAAKTQEVTNSKNTVNNLKRFIGRNFDEQEVQEAEKKFLYYNLVAAENGAAGAKVQYNGEEAVFDMTQLAAMFLTQIKQVSEISLENPISAAVIAVPAYYTDRQRHAILSAAEIANINVARLINEPTAAALSYGITRVSDLPEKDPRNVCFIDIGHSAMSVSVASFTKEKAEIKSCTYDRHLGGRVIDDILVKHFIEKIKEKHKVDLSTNNKAILRLRVAIEKMKHMLSSNAQSVLQIECLTDVLDINFQMKREELEQICAHVFEKVSYPIKIALHDAGFKKEDIHFVEIIGGSTRIPAIQAKISEIFERPEVLSKTLNMDEAIARGAALQCAIVSPLFKVRDYQIKDVTAYGIKIGWDAVTGDSATTESVIFKPADPTPSSKGLTFYRAQPFELRAEYSNIESLPPGTVPFIGRFAINDVKATKEGGPSDVKIKARLNESGIFSIETAELLEEIEDSTAMETDKPATPAEGEAAKDESGDAKMGDEPKLKKKKVKRDLPVVSSTSKLTPAQLDKFRQIEGQLIASDKLIKETQEKRNALESYIYEWRNKVEGSHVEFVAPAIKDEFLAKLSEAETFLYDEGDTATKSVVVEKIGALHKYGNPIETRYREADERSYHIGELQKTIEQFHNLATSGDVKYDHIESADRQKVVDECAKKAAWLKESIAAQDKLPKFEDPKLLVKELKNTREGLVLFSAPIMNKPKPKVEPPKDTPKPESTPAPAQPNGDAPATQEAPKAEPGNMDVD